MRTVAYSLWSIFVYKFLPKLLHNGCWVVSYNWMGHWSSFLSTSNKLCLCLAQRINFNQFSFQCFYQFICCLWICLARTHSEKGFWSLHFIMVAFQKVNHFIFNLKLLALFNGLIYFGFKMAGMIWKIVIINIGTFSSLCGI